MIKTATMHQKPENLHKLYATGKKPSMLRRCENHDYTDRQIYLLTLVTEGRRPLFGRLHYDILGHLPTNPRILLSPLGQAVEAEWHTIPRFHPEISLISLCVMPDHLHGILFVETKMSHHLGKIVSAFKSACNCHFRELFPQSAPSSAPSVSHSPSRGLLFARGYNDKLLKGEEQLLRWRRYLEDNPRRLMMKQAYPDLLRVKRNISYAGYSFSAIGNLLLLDAPEKIQIQCSRHLTEAEIERKKEEMLARAVKGAILVSPCISLGEKTIMRTVCAAHCPVIVLRENGFAALAKPGGRSFDLCAAGKLLLLSPWAHHNERQTITRDRCCSLNSIAEAICEQ